MRIPFNRAYAADNTLAMLQDVVGQRELTAGRYVARCEAWLREALGAPQVFLAPSCTDALEMAMLLLDLRPGDEVIMPSYTFASTANAVVLRGGVPVFVDIRPDTMNLDERLIAPAITSRTRAIVVVHYAGVACEMDVIRTVAQQHGLHVIEDAAQGVGASYRGKPLGTLGEIGALSFHQTKNVTSGEGGAVVINDAGLIERADILRHKGVNRTAFLARKTSYYTWMDVGSSWAMAELPAAYLYGNLAAAGEIQRKRMALWRFYFEQLQPLAEQGLVALPSVPEECRHNAHMFYLKLADQDSRSACIDALAARGIMAVFHYVPLHSSPAGRRYGRFHGEDRHTTAESERLLRLPLYCDLTSDEAREVVDGLFAFFGVRR